MIKQNNYTIIFSSGQSVQFLEAIHQDCKRCFRFQEHFTQCSLGPILKPGEIFCPFWRGGGTKMNSHSKLVQFEKLGQNKKSLKCTTWLDFTTITRNTCQIRCMYCTLIQLLEIRNAFVYTKYTRHFKSNDLKTSDQPSILWFSSPCGRPATPFSVPRFHPIIILRVRSVIKTTVRTSQQNRNAMAQKTKYKNSNHVNFQCSQYP